MTVVLEAMTPRLRCAALLFDLDGVLIDSTPAVARVWTKWALERGFDPREVVAPHGRPSLTTVREYLPNIQLSQRLDPAISAIEADPGQLDQIMSLCFNARDAMPRGG